MIRMQTIAVVVLVLHTTLYAQARVDSLFPSSAELGNQKPSLDSAISQFENILQDSAAGHVRSVNSNDAYNQARAAELQKALTEKRKYLASIPDTVSRQFDALMEQFAGFDQATKNRMADDLHKRWQAIESQVHREIKELEEQLAVSTGRLSDLAVERQIMQMSNALAGSEEALRQKKTTERASPNTESPAFSAFRDLAVRRILSQIQGFCPIHVKSFQTELTIDYLDK